MTPLSPGVPERRHGRIARRIAVMGAGIPGPATQARDAEVSMGSRDRSTGIEYADGRGRRGLVAKARRLLDRGSVLVPRSVSGVHQHPARPGLRRALPPPAGVRLTYCEPGSMTRHLDVAQLRLARKEG